MNIVDKYSIRSFWSDEDESYISVCSEFPSLSAVGDSREEATEEMLTLLEFVVGELVKEGKEAPNPIASRELKGNILLRVDPFQHRRVLNIAEESKRSMNQTLNLLISLGIEKYNGEIAESKTQTAIEELRSDLMIHDLQMTSAIARNKKDDESLPDKTNVIPISDFGFPLRDRYKYSNPFSGQNMQGRDNDIDSDEQLEM